MFSKIITMLDNFVKKLENLEQTINQNSIQQKENEASMIDTTKQNEQNYKKKAFEVVMQQTTIPLKKQEEIFAIWQPFNSKNFYSQFIEILSQDDWKWYEFIKWKEIFDKDKIYPYMWNKYPEMCINVLEEYPIINNFNSYSGTYMKVGELKKLLNQLKIEIPIKSKRDNLIKLIKDNVTYELLKEKLPDLYETQKSNFEKKQYQGKIAIFEHYLNNKYVKYRDWDRCTSLEKYGYKKYLSVVIGCPIEENYAKKIQKITFENSPPLFPGDRTSINIKKN